MALMDATADGFEAAGLIEVADICRATVMDSVVGGDVANAMDVAREFAELQKIKKPLAKGECMLLNC